jgi:hypothetical protein
MKSIRIMSLEVDGGATDATVEGRQVPPEISGSVSSENLHTNGLKLPIALFDYFVCAQQERLAHPQPCGRPSDAETRRAFGTLVKLAWC